VAGSDTGRGRSAKEIISKVKTRGFSRAFTASEAAIRHRLSYRDTLEADAEVFAKVVYSVMKETSFDRNCYHNVSST
jgi:hypothetical protein